MGVGVLRTLCTGDNTVSAGDNTDVANALTALIDL